MEYALLVNAGGEDITLMDEQVKNSTENTEVNENIEKDDLVHDFSGIKSTLLTPKLLVVFIVVILLGVGSGYFLSKNSSSGSTSATSAGSTSDSSSLSKGSTIGSNDTKTFKDIVEGTLQEGGIEDEGQFHLVRPGGDSQNVYLTSSIVDLSKFVDKKIKVWGQTQKAQHAGWLMDVGRVEVL